MSKNVSESITQINFLAAQRKHKTVILLVRISVLLLFLLFWELLSRLELIDSFFFSSPSGIVKCLLLQFRENHLLSHIMTTLAETFLSFLLVMLISILFAFTMWYFSSFAEVIDPYLVLLNSLPKSALAPLFIVWLGTGSKTIVIAGISVVLFSSILTLYSSYRHIDSGKLLLIQTLGGSKLDCYFKIVFPGTLTMLYSTAKVNIGLSLVGVIIGEFLAARKGIGYLIIYGTQIFKLDLVIMGILLLGFFSLLILFLLNFLEKISLKHFD